MRPQLGKDKILDAAVLLFSRAGYHATSISDIAAAAGVSKGLMYNYFGSKEILLLAIIDHASEKMFNVAPVSSRPSPSFTAELRAFLDGFQGLLEGHKEYLAFQVSLFVQPDLKEIVRIPVQARATQLLQAVVEMFTVGGCDNADVLARRFVMELDGLTLHYLAVFENLPLGTMIDRLFDNYKDYCK